MKSTKVNPNPLKDTVFSTFFEKKRMEKEREERIILFDREQRSERGPRSVLVVVLVATLRIITVKKLLMFTNVHYCPLVSTNGH